MVHMQKIQRFQVILNINWVIARDTSCPILHHTMCTDLFFGHNLCVFAPNDLRFIGKVLMTIIHLDSFFHNFQK